MDKIEIVSDAIDRAECRGREGPYGGYNYDGLLVIRDFRTLGSKGEWVHETRDREEHESEFERLTKQHKVHTALKALSDAGYAVVPKVPTEKQVDAFSEATGFDYDGSIRDGYTAMIAAGEEL